MGQDSIRESALRSAAGQVSGGPSWVAVQSRARISSPVRPPGGKNWNGSTTTAARQPVSARSAMGRPAGGCKSGGALPRSPALLPMKCGPTGHAYRIIVVSMRSYRNRNVKRRNAPSSPTGAMAAWFKPARLRTAAATRLGHGRFVTPLGGAGFRQHLPRSEAGGMMLTGWDLQQPQSGHATLDPAQGIARHRSPRRENRRQRLRRPFLRRSPPLARAMTGPTCVRADDPFGQTGRLIRSIFGPR